MGMSEDLAEIKVLLKQAEESKKTKKFKLPWGKKVGKAQAKRNWITIMKINENGHVNFSKKQIDEQTIIEDGVPRLATNQYVMFYKSSPMIILPSWNVEPLPVRPAIYVESGKEVDTTNLPFNPKENLEESFMKGTNIKGFKVLMAKMLKETVNPKKPMSNVIKWIIGLAVVGLIGYALISGGK